MQNHDPALWAWIAAWLYANKDQISYAVIAAVFSLIRSLYASTRWKNRLLDAVSCSALAYFSSPLLEVVSRLLHLDLPDTAPTVVAIFIGYVGNDFIRDFVNRKIGRLGGDNDTPRVE